MTSRFPFRPTQLPRRVAAVLFDMDNTLVDSERAWVAAAADIWTEAGGDPTGKGVVGGTLQGLVDEFIGDYPDADAVAVSERLMVMLAGHLRTALAPMPGAPPLLRRLSARMPITIASNSPSQIVTDVVTALGWDDLFTAALGTEHVVHPKPAPDLYLAAAAQCGVDITDCVVFEDSPLGAQAGRAAGAFVVTVGNISSGLGNVNVSSLEDPLVTAWEPEVIR